MKITIVSGSVLIAMVMLAVGCTPAPSTPAPAPTAETMPVTSEPPSQEPTTAPTAPTQEPSETTPEPAKSTPATTQPPAASPDSTAPAPNQAAQAPNIAPVHAPRTLNGAKVWLFAIDDGSPQLAVSAEADGQLLVGRLDVNDPTAQPTWQMAASPADTGGLTIADHWHIYAHNAHWLVFSTAGDGASYLLKLDKEFKRLAITHVGHTDGPTNDMFMTAEPDGMAVGHFAPGYGSTIHRFDTNAKKTGQVRIGGGAYSHGNGSSAISIEGGYLILATETMLPTITSAVRMLRFDSSWRPISASTMLDEEGTHAAMASAVRLESGYTIVNLRARTGVSPRPKAPSAPPPAGPLPDDSGTLVRLVLDRNGTIVSRETLVSEKANRPHTSVSGNLLITTWDEVGTIRIRTDRIQ